MFDSWSVIGTSKFQAKSDPLEVSFNCSFLKLTDCPIHDKVKESADGDHHVKNWNSSTTDIVVNKKNRSWTEPLTIL